MAERRRGYAVGDARRERILNVALEEFGANGFRGASLARIAERAGLSQPGLLHHFPSKADLLIAVLEYRDELDAVRISWGGDALADLHGLVRLVELNSQVPGLVQLFAVMSGEAIAPDHPARSWAQTRYRTLRKLMADSIRAGAESGELRSDVDAEAQAGRLIAMMDGLQLQWLVEPEAIDMAAVFRGYVEELIESLRP